MKRLAVLVALCSVAGCGATVAEVGGGEVQPSALVASLHAPGPSSPPAKDPVRSGGVRTRTASPGRAAGQLVIAALGVRARIRPVRFAGSRLQIPASVAEVGLWSDGARLGDAVGTTVLVGHVSDNSDRPGVLSPLVRLRPGARVRVRTGARTYLFRAVRVRSYPKARLPRGVFSQSGPHRLVLITCSHKVTYPNGAFHYAQNLVVIARPLR